MTKIRSYTEKIKYLVTDVQRNGRARTEYRMQILFIVGNLTNLTLALTVSNFTLPRVVQTSHLKQINNAQQKSKN